MRALCGSVCIGVDARCTSIDHSPYVGLKPLGTAGVPPFWRGRRLHPGPQALLLRLSGMREGKGCRASPTSRFRLFARPQGCDPRHGACATGVRRSRLWREGGRHHSYGVPYS